MFKSRQEVAKTDHGAQALCTHRGIKPDHNLHGYWFLIRWKTHLHKEHGEWTCCWEAKAWMKTRSVSRKIHENLSGPGNKQKQTNKKMLSWLLMLSWAFKNPARMRLETQPRLWIIDLEQPKTDALKRQGILLAFSLGYNPHPDSITSAPFRSGFRRFLPMCSFLS